MKLLSAFCIQGEILLGADHLLQNIDTGEEGAAVTWGKTLWLSSFWQIDNLQKNWYLPVMLTQSCR